MHTRNGDVIRTANDVIVDGSQAEPVESQMQPQAPHFYNTGSAPHANVTHDYSAVLQMQETVPTYDVAPVHNIHPQYASYESLSDEPYLDPAELRRLQEFHQRTNRPVLDVLRR